jgi:hypothetical protein
MSLQEIEIGADHQPTLRLRQALRDAEGDYVTDSYGNKTYQALDMSLYDDIFVYVTVKGKDTLVAKYKRASDGTHQALDSTDEVEGKLYFDLKREALSDLESGDIIEVEIGYHSAGAGFTGNKFVRISTQEIGILVKPHKALRNAVG